MVAPGPSSLRRGRVIDGRYRVEGLLGRGGMNQVVHATDLQVGRAVAIKLPRLERIHRRKDVARLVREARAIEQLSSPHVARLYEAGTFLEDGIEVPYLVLEYVDGVDLATWLRAKGPLDAASAATIAVQACDAIGEAHARGLVHRDVKPANVMLTVTAGELAVKVLDFGIARSSDEHDGRLTTTGDLVGSPVYMAPEQMRPAAMVDARADVWSLGVVLFEMIAGRVPFESPSLPDLCLKVLLDEPPPLPASAPALYAEIVRRCLAKEPSARYASAREVAEALLPLASPSVPMSVTDLEIAAMDAAAHDHPPSSDAIELDLSGPRSVPPAKRHRWWGASSVIAILALALVATVSVLSSSSSSPLTTPPSHATTPALATPQTLATPTPQHATPPHTTPQLPERVTDQPTPPERAPAHVQATSRAATRRTKPVPIPVRVTEPAAVPPAISSPPPEPAAPALPPPPVATTRDPLESPF